MIRDLRVGLWLRVEKDCEMTYQISTLDEVSFLIGGVRGEGFEFDFDADSLRRFLKVAESALEELQVEKVEYRKQAQAAKVKRDKESVPPRLTVAN